MSVPAVKLIVNTSAPNKDGLLASFASKISAPQNLFFRGDINRLEIYPVVDVSGPNADYYWSPLEIDPEDALFGIGDADKASESGTADLNYNGDGSALTGVIPTIAASALQAAINANVAVAATGQTVTVAEISDGDYQITWSGTGAKHLFQGDPSNLVPQSVVIAQWIVEGDGSTKAVQLLRFLQRPYVYVDEWTATPDKSVNFQTIYPGGVSQKAQFAISITPEPYTGTLSIEGSGPLAVNGTQEQWQAAMGADWVVLKTGAASLTLTRAANGAYTLEESDINIDEIKVYRGLVGTLRFNAPALIQRFLTLDANVESFSTRAQLRYDDGTNKGTLLFTRVTIFRDVLNSDALGPVDWNQGYYTKTETDAKFNGAKREAILWVEETGSDESGLTNDPTKPFATLDAALAAISGPATIRIGSGTFEAPSYTSAKPDVCYIGAGRPHLNPGKTALVGGTIIEGVWELGDATPGIVIRHLGVDVGSDWCAAKNGGAQADGITVDDVGGLGGVLGLQIEDIIVLMKPGTGIGHGLSIQDAVNATLDNIEVWYGVHGIAFKGQYSNLTNLNLNGCYHEGLILKNGGTDLRCEHVNVSNVTYTRSGQPGFAVVLNGVDSTFGPLSNINITNVTSYDAGAILLNPATANGIRDVNITNVTAEGATAIYFNAGGGTCYGVKIVNVVARNSPGEGYSINASVDAIFINAAAVSCATGFLQVGGAATGTKIIGARVVNCGTGFVNYSADDFVFVGPPTLSGNTTNFADNGSGGSVRSDDRKTTTGDYSAGNYSGRLVVNEFDNTVKIFADGAWRQLATW